MWKILAVSEDIAFDFVISYLREMTKLLRILFEKSLNDSSDQIFILFG